MTLRAEYSLGNVHAVSNIHLVVSVTLPSPAKVLKVENILEDIVANAHLVQSRLRRPPFGCLSPLFLSVREPRRDCGVRPPSHHRAMWILKPRCLVNSRSLDSHLCAMLSVATRVFLRGGIHTRGPVNVHGLARSIVSWLVYRPGAQDVYSCEKGQKV